jgi:hypothetical protein
VLPVAVALPLEFRVELISPRALNTCSVLPVAVALPLEFLLLFTNARV